MILLSESDQNDTGQPALHSTHTHTADAEESPSGAAVAPGGGKGLTRAVPLAIKARSPDDLTAALLRQGQHLIRLDA